MEVVWQVVKQTDWEGEKEIEEKRKRERLCYHSLFFLVRLCTNKCQSVFIVWSTKNAFGNNDLIMSDQRSHVLILCICFPALSALGCLRFACTLRAARAVHAPSYTRPWGAAALWCALCWLQQVLQILWKGLAVKQAHTVHRTASSPSALAAWPGYHLCMHSWLPEGLVIWLGDMPWANHLAAPSDIHLLGLELEFLLATSQGPGTHHLAWQQGCRLNPISTFSINEWFNNAGNRGRYSHLQYGWSSRRRQHSSYNCETVAFFFVDFFQTWCWRWLSWIRNCHLCSQR